MKQPQYHPPLFFRSGHLQTIYPSWFRKFDTGFYTRERIDTSDGDFLDLDWSAKGFDRLAIVSHGLEGDSHRAYVVGMVKAMNANRWDAMAWNFRSCSGEVNRQLYSYHSGWTHDLEAVIEHAKNTGRYKEIALIGFSLGGNITLVFLGEKGPMADKMIKRAVVFSVPCDLLECAANLDKPVNWFYQKRFVRMLIEKVKDKSLVMPEKFSHTNSRGIKTLKDFDDRYTAPINGFKDAEDYYKQCSSRQFIPKIKVPTLIVNAKNDPLLSKSCYPIEEAGQNKNVTLEMPESGGHTGFIAFNKKQIYWSEKRAVMFLNGS